jgi:hypothetical protein
MAKFVVTLHYTVAPAVPGRRQFDVLADRVGSGHRFSMLGADTLAVSVRIKAGSAAEAVQILDIRVQAAWPMVDDPGWDSGDNDWGGGTAGVREPRRPRTPPGHLSAALELPRQA